MNESARRLIPRLNGRVLLAPLAKDLHRRPFELWHARRSGQPVAPKRERVCGRVAHAVCWRGSRACVRSPPLSHNQQVTGFASPQNQDRRRHRAVAGTSPRIPASPPYATVCRSNCWRSGRLPRCLSGDEPRRPGCRGRKCGEARNRWDPSSSPAREARQKDRHTWVFSRALALAAKAAAARV